MISREDLCRRLENDGHLSAAEELAAGVDPTVVAREVLAKPSRYDDGATRELEARLQCIIDGEAVN